MESLIKSIGSVFSILIIAGIGLISMYLTYILGIGVVVLVSIFIGYHIFKGLKKEPKSNF